MSWEKVRVQSQGARTQRLYRATLRSEKVASVSLNKPYSSPHALMLTCCCLCFILRGPFPQSNVSWVVVLSFCPLPSFSLPLSLPLHLSDSGPRDLVRTRER